LGRKTIGLLLALEARYQLEQGAGFEKSYERSAVNQYNPARDSARTMRKGCGTRAGLAGEGKGNRVRRETMLRFIGYQSNREVQGDLPEL
jgi:hypothetical protein